MRTWLRKIDDSYGQFPPQVCPASESDDDAFVGRNISQEAESSNEASSSEDTAGKISRPEPLGNSAADDADDDEFGKFDTFRSHTTPALDSRDNDEFANFPRQQG